MIALLLSQIQRLKRSKVDKQDGMSLSQNNYTNEEKDKLNNLINYQIITIPKTKIINNSITLSNRCYGDVLFGIAHVYDDLEIPYMREFPCVVLNDGITVTFLSEDELNDKYCVVSYLTIRE